MTCSTKEIGMILGDIPVLLLAVLPSPLKTKVAICRMPFIDYIKEVISTGNNAAFNQG